MQVYLPIAEISANLYILVGVGAGVGFISGLFGVGGGFLLTPLLFFIGVPPAVAVASGVNQVVGSSFSAMIGHLRRKSVDFRMGLVLLAGGMAGSTLGVWLFKLLRGAGYFEPVVSLTYLLLLSGIGGLMLIEGVRALRKSAKTDEAAAKPRSRPPRVGGKRKTPLSQRLPFRLRFKRSRLYISVIPPLLIGFVIGLLAALLGVGGGFILIPAMIYLLHMPSNVVVGTSLFQTMFVSAYATLMHAMVNRSVDLFLALLLLLGGVIGAQIGARAGMRLRGEQLRVLLALVVLGVALKLLLDLAIEPEEHFSATMIVSDPS